MFRRVRGAANINEEQCLEFAKFLGILDRAPQRNGLPEFLSGATAENTKHWHAVCTTIDAVTEELKREQKGGYPRGEHVRDLKRALAVVERLPVLLSLSPPRRARPNNEWGFLADVLARYIHNVLVSGGHPARSLEPSGAMARVVRDVLCRVTGRRFTCAQVSGVLKRNRKGFEVELAKFERGDDFGWDA